MTDGATGELLVGLVCAATCAIVSAALVPTLIRRLPPPRDPSPGRASYPDLAAWSGLPWLAGLLGALVGGTLGWRLGWDPALVWLLPMLPWAIALAYIDARVRLLPTRLVAPTYALVVIGVVAASLITHDPQPVLRGLIGWAVVGALFGLLWWTSAGMGYGDVRLAGVLGFALAAVGWAEVVIGIYAAFVIGLLGWGGLRLVGIIRGRSFPFGPALVAGAWVGVLTGPTVVGLVTGR